MELKRVKTPCSPGAVLTVIATLQSLQSSNARAVRARLYCKGSDGSSVYWGRQSVLGSVLSASTQQYHVFDRIIKCLNSQTSL